jgi:hypothetical protein
MQLLNFYKSEILIYPGETDLVNFWTKKWGITVTQLNEAILETGSVNATEIKKYFTRKGLLPSFSSIVNSFKLAPQPLKPFVNKFFGEIKKPSKTVWIRYSN